MYVLYTKNKSGILINWFATEQDCLNHIQLISASKFKIKKVQSQTKLYFQQALDWSEEVDDFVIDIEKAKILKMNELRVERDLLFDKLDKIYFKALQEDDKTKQLFVSEKKQQLRDFPQNALPENEEDLIKYQPEVFLQIKEIVI